jgi:hypothetical protein
MSSDQIIEIDFKYFNNPRWHKTEVTCLDYIKILASGMLDEKPLDCVVAFDVTTAEDKVRFIYSFTRLKQGMTPWTLESQQS